MWPGLVPRVFVSSKWTKTFCTYGSIYGQMVKEKVYKGQRRLTWEPACPERLFSTIKGWMLKTNILKSMWLQSKWTAVAGIRWHSIGHVLDAHGHLTPKEVVRSGLNSHTSEMFCMSSLSASLTKIESILKALAWRHRFSATFSSQVTL